MDEWKDVLATATANMGGGTMRTVCDDCYLSGWIVRNAKAIEVGRRVMAADGKYFELSYDRSSVEEENTRLCAILEGLEHQERERVGVRIVRPHCTGHWSIYRSDIDDCNSPWHFCCSGRTAIEALRNLTQDEPIDLDDATEEG